MGDIIFFGETAHRLFLVLSVAMARMAPVFVIAPFLSGRRVRSLFRNSLAMAMAAFLLPWLLATLPEERTGFGGLTLLLAKETAIGLVIGVLSSLVFHAAAGIGYLVDNQRGLSMSQTDDPLSGESTSLMGSLTVETLIMLFVASGGLALFVQTLLASYAFWPPYSFWPDFSAPAIREMVLSQFAWYMTTIVLLAFPMLLVCFLVDLGMGLMNRFAPQLNVFFLAMPVKSGLTLALMLTYWAVMFRVLGKDVLRMSVLWSDLRTVWPG